MLCRILFWEKDNFRNPKVTRLNDKLLEPESNLALNKIKAEPHDPLWKIYMNLLLDLDYLFAFLLTMSDLI